MIIQRIVVKLIRGIINIAGNTLTPTRAIPVILPVRAVINNDKKTKYTGPNKYPIGARLIKQMPEINEIGRNSAKSNP